MLKLRNLLAVSIVLISMMVFLIPLAAAQPAQQATETPEPTATVVATVTPNPTSTSEATRVPTSTSVAPAVSPLATPVGTPSTLPRTGESDGNTAALALIVMAVGALIVVGAIGLAMSSRRTQ